MSHEDCISQDEYTRRITVIADTLQQISEDLETLNVKTPTGFAAPEWAAAAAIVRSALTDLAHLEAEQGVTALEAMLTAKADD